MKKFILFAGFCLFVFIVSASVGKNDLLDYDEVIIYGRKSRESVMPIGKDGVAETANWITRSTSTTAGRLCIQWIKYNELLKMSEESQENYRLRIDFLKDGEIVKTLCFDYEHYKPALEIIDKAMR